jgi:hypothetical protein
VGKDNDAKGFNDQSDNLDLSAIGTGNGNGNGNGGTPEEKCALCLANVDLTAVFNIPALPADIDTTAELCAALAASTLNPAVLSAIRDLLTPNTIQCLIAADISLGTVRG